MVFATLSTLVVLGVSARFALLPLPCSAHCAAFTRANLATHVAFRALSRKRVRYRKELNSFKFRDGIGGRGDAARLLLTLCHRVRMGGRSAETIFKNRRLACGRHKLA